MVTGRDGFLLRHGDPKASHRFFLHSHMSDTDDAIRSREPARPCAFLIRLPTSTIATNPSIPLQILHDCLGHNALAWYTITPHIHLPHHVASRNVVENAGNVRRSPPRPHSTLSIHLVSYTIVITTGASSSVSAVPPWSNPSAPPTKNSSSDTIPICRSAAWKRETAARRNSTTTSTG